MLTQARRALAESDRAVRLARLAARGEAGELSISVLPAAAPGLLPAIIRSYRDAHPAIGVTVSESFDDEQLDALAAGRIDAGFLRAAAAPPGIRLQTLLTEPLLAGLPADHRLARHDRIALSELAAEPFVFFPRHRSVLAYDEFIASCRAAASRPDCWRHVICERFHPMEIRLADGPGSHDELLTGVTGALRVTESTSSAGEVHRTSKHVSSSEPEMYQLIVQARGSIVGGRAGTGSAVK